MAYHTQSNRSNPQYILFSSTDNRGAHTSCSNAIQADDFLWRTLIRSIGRVYLVYDNPGNGYGRGRLLYNIQ